MAQYERIYVKVFSICDTTGYCEPKSIIWSDGRIFPIESVRDFYPSSVSPSGRHIDCYTVLIHGEERFLYYEPTDPRFLGRRGRWFVERCISQ
jgi:hypothetical protein